MARVPGTDDARLTPRVTRPWAVIATATGRTSAAAAALLLAGTLAGCGSTSVHDLPPAAEPARSPAEAQPPAGAVTQVGGHLEGIVIDSASQTGASALRNPPRLHFFSTRGRSAHPDLPLPGDARHLALQSSVSGSRRIADDGATEDQTGVRVLVPVESAGRLLGVDLSSGRIVSDVKVGERPHDVTALSPTRAVVGNEGGNTITLVDGNRAVRTARVATQPGGISSLREGSLVAVVSVRERKLQIYDGTTLRLLASEPAGVGPTHVACAPQGPCFVLDTEGQSLLVFRVGPGGTSLRLTRRVYLGGSPYGVALDPSHSRTRLWITDTASNQLVELAAQGRPHVLSRRPTVRQGNSVGVDPASGDVVVAGAATGQLQQLTNPASPNR